MIALKNSLRDLLRYPSAVVGTVIILFLLVVSVYVLVTIPYSEAIRRWRGGEEVWYQNPKYAPPAWFNYFSNKKQPVSFSVRTTDGSMTKTITPSSDPEISAVDITYSFDFAYDGPPQELMIYFTGQYEEKLPFVSVSWVTPDGRTIRIADMAMEHSLNFRFSQDQKLQKRLKTEQVMQAIFVDPESETTGAFKRPVSTGDQRYRL